MLELAKKRFVQFLQRAEEISDDSLRNQQKEQNVAKFETLLKLDDVQIYSNIPR